MNNNFSDFIAENVVAIVDEFEHFARTSGPAAAHLDPHALRDHAHAMLEAVAADMAEVQGLPAQHEKAIGAAGKAAVFSQVKRTAQLHAQHRFGQGFSLSEMVSEYRALRASVIRRWVVQLGHADAGQLDELTRFGEGLDEGLTEAIAWYSRRLEESRNLLLGVLAHDLRSPLGAVIASAEYLLRTDRLQDGELRAAARIASSSKRMTGYVRDLLDFTQTLLGQDLNIARSAVDLVPLCEDVVDELRAAHPRATVHVQVTGHPTGLWDGARLAQLVSNLVTNAVIHGDPLQPVTVTVADAGGAPTLAVHNAGPPIAEAAMPMLFRPLMRQRTATDEHLQGSSGMGLGLYIAREIAEAHGGTIAVESRAETGTTFTLRLPLS